MQDITSVTLRDHCHIEVCIYCKHALKVKFSQAISTQNQHWSPLLHVCVNAYASLDAFSSGAPVKIVGQRSHSPHEVVVGRSCLFMLLHLTLLSVWGNSQPRLNLFGYTSFTFSFFKCKVISLATLSVQPSIK